MFTQLNFKTVPFQTVHFSISTLFSSIWPIDRTLSGATTWGQSGPGSDGNKGVLCIPESSCITGAPLSDCFVSYPEHLTGKSYTSAEMQSVYPAALAKWARLHCYKKKCIIVIRIHLWNSDINRYVLKQSS